MASMPELKIHQQITVDEAADKAGIFFRMRVGKTATAIRLACSRTKSAIVICPKSLQTQWCREVEKWNNTDCKFKIISKETFKRDWNLLDAFQTIIVDEAHLNFANFKNQMFKALQSYKKKNPPKCIFLLTGTPMTSSSYSIFSYGLLLDKPWRWVDWQKRFFFMMKLGHRMIPQARTDKDDELRKIIRSLGTVIALEDVAEVGEDEEIVEYFSLTPEQKQLIKESFDPLPIKRFTLSHQIENGVKKSDGYTEDMIFACEKDTRIRELVNQNQKIILVCRYINQVKKIRSLVEDLGREIYEIHGQTKKSAGDIAVQAEADPTAIVIAQCDTCTGYELASFDIMVFVSMSFSHINVDQMRSRMKAMRKSTGCTYINLLISGDSVDQGIYDCVQRKQDFDVDLFAHK